MQGVPQGFHTVSPYLFVRGASDAIEFYKKAFGATELLKLLKANGQVMHAEIQIGDAQVMLVDENQKSAETSPLPPHTNLPIHMHMYVADVDASLDQAVAAGAKLIMPARDSDDGERRGGVEDPFGFTWWIATQKVAASRAELQHQYDEKMKKQ